MNFIKVGKSFINLDRVNEVRPGVLGTLDVYYSGVTTDGNTLEYNVTNYDGAEAAALLAWLDSVSIDVVEQQAQREAQERQGAALQKLGALAYAHGTSYSDQVQPSFPGARMNAAHALTLTDELQAVYHKHVSECGIELFDGEQFAEWQRNFVSGVLSR